MFTLNNINIESVARKYPDINLFDSKSIENHVTIINEKSVSRSLNGDVIMTTLVGERLGVQTNTWCFWDRHPFTSIPLGCPIRLIESQVEQTYYSQFSDQECNINRKIEELSPKIYNSLLSGSDLLSYEPIFHKHYIIDGIFCSVNCIMAFIKEEQKKGMNINPIYIESEKLLYFLQHDLLGKTTSILAADSWRLLSEFGGKLSIKKFRENFNAVQYENIDEIYYPICVQASFMFRENINIA